MAGLRLRPMTAAEFEEYRSRQIREYAAARVRAGYWSPDLAEMLATRQTDELLPDGLSTARMVLLIAEDDRVGVVGRAWVALDGPGGSGPWIFHLEVVPPHRGKGYGRALLDAIEQEIARHGGATITLNVFADNDVARGLYESSGYKTTSLHMRKELSTGSDDRTS